ncbi:MAG: hypothetical protein IPI87_11670 [Betaproteobacteria bacterium]|nr:hypothetical protein [Betaproteobacteria bacterium]
MAGIDDARLRSPQAADTQSLIPHKQSKEAVGVAASARGPRGDRRRCVRRRGRPSSPPPPPPGPPAACRR